MYTLKFNVLVTNCYLPLKMWLSKQITYFSKFFNQIFTQVHFVQEHVRLQIGGEWCLPRAAKFPCLSINSRVVTLTKISLLCKKKKKVCLPHALKKPPAFTTVLQTRHHLDPVHQRSIYWPPILKRQRWPPILEVLWTKAKTKPLSSRHVPRTYRDLFRIFKFIRLHDPHGCLLAFRQS